MRVANLDANADSKVELELDRTTRELMLLTPCEARYGWPR